MTSVITIDLGAESGRVTRVDYDGRRMSFGPSHRFANEPVVALGVLQWDALRLWREMVADLGAVAAAGGPSPVSVGVDTFGLDFALLDAGGRMVAGPVHHRDTRRLQGMELAERAVGREELYRATGTRVLAVNGLFELTAMCADGDGALAAADRLIMMADLFHLWLGGTVACEWTLATTSGATAPDGGWALDLIGALGIPPRLFREIVAPGTPLGALRSDIAEATGLRGMSVIAPAGHDTACAVAAVPFAGRDAAFISSGTWSLVGIETPRPVMSDAAMAAGLSNEGGVAGRSRLLKNVVGLWLLQESRRQWGREGWHFTYEELVELTTEAPQLHSVIDLDDPALLLPGDMPARIRDACVQAGEPIPESPGAVVRCILESLALTYRAVFADLERATGRPLRAVHVVGGGVRNRLLCQWTADASGLPIVAGPVEATTLGNALVQLIALAELADVEEGRRLVTASAKTVTYEPRDGARWDAAAVRVTEARARAPAAPSASFP